MLRKIGLAFFCERSELVFVLVADNYSHNKLLSECFFFRMGQRYLCGIVSYGPPPPNCGTTAGTYARINSHINLRFVSQADDLKNEVTIDFFAGSINRSDPRKSKAYRLELLNIQMLALSSIFNANFVKLTKFCK